MVMYICPNCGAIGPRRGHSGGERQCYVCSYTGDIDYFEEASEDYMSIEDMKEMFSDTVLDPDTKVNIRFNDNSVEIDVHGSDVSMRLHSTRKDPQVSVKGDLATMTGSYMTVTMGDHTRLVESEEALHWTLPAEIFKGQEEKFNE